jgi:CRISPR-associated protein Cas1
MGFREVCIESRSRCSYEGGYLVVTTPVATSKIHLSEISSLMIGTPQTYISTYLLSELAKYKIPVIFCDDKSLPVAESLPLHAASDCSEKPERQLQWTLPRKKQLWKTIVQHKIYLQSEVLSLTGAADSAITLKTMGTEVKSGDVTNREAVAAAAYFPALFGHGFSREDDCPTNALLNYGYSIVMSRVSREIVGKGYLTQVGIHHHSSLNPWNFSCDLMEPFRPMVDLIVKRNLSIGFTKESRHLLLDMENSVVRFEDGSYKLGSVIACYVRKSIDYLESGDSDDRPQTYTLA